MFKVDVSGKKLTVYLNDKPVITHTPEDPFVRAGKGRWESNDITITDSIQEYTALTSTQYDSGRNILRLSGENFSISFLLAEINEALVLTPQRSTTGLNRLKLSFTASSSQAVFGGGAQYKTLNLRKKRIPLWVREKRLLENNRMWPLVRFKGLMKHASKFPFPNFFTSDYFWYAFDCSTVMVADFKESLRHRFDFWEIPTSITIGKTNSAQECISNFVRINGRTPMLPQWAYEGACIEVQGGNKAVAETLGKLLEKNASISSLWLKDWSGLLHTPAGNKPFFDWVWNKELYPKLDSVIKELALRNIRVLAYVNPHLSIEGTLFAEASLAGYLVKKPQGGNYIHDMGGFMVGHLDLTNPNACRWYKEIVKTNILNVGFSGYLCDMGDYLPSDALLHSGQDPLKIRNRWAVMWAQLNRDTIREAGRSSDCVYWTQTGWVGSGQQVLLPSTGEHYCGWDKENGLPSALTASLSLSCSGFGLSQSDCGGNVTFMQKRGKELLLRWIDYAAFTPVMRMVKSNAQNWQYDSDKETFDHFVRMSKVHRQLSQYIRTCMKDNATDGISIMRPMFFDYSDDKIACTLQYQYMLGMDMLVSPILTLHEKKHKVYIPDGLWIHLWTGKEYKQGFHFFDTAFGNTPAFYKAGCKYHELFRDLPGKL